MYDGTRGGNDTLIGGDHAVFNDLNGDADSMFGNAVGGNDTLIGGDDGVHTNFLAGDATFMYDTAAGGNDTLIGGDRSFNNSLFGDANVMRGDSRGGNDTLIGGDDNAFVTFLLGDAGGMLDHAHGGDDTLISGRGTDYMWGDGGDVAPTATTGADTFVFAPDSGNDLIFDFRQSDGDKIDVSAYGFHGIDDMAITGMGADTVIVFDAIDSVTLVGMDPGALHASDFIFG
jgi:serralysin